jgi:hypothetical protein
VPVSGSMSWLTAAIPSSSWCSIASTCRLKTEPGVRHPQDAAGALQQRRADLRLQPGQGPRHALTASLDSSSLTSVTVVPSATCWNQRSESVSITMTLAHGSNEFFSLDA